MSFLDSYQLLYEATPLKNKGFVVEALVTIAIFIKFKKKGEKVFYSDLEKYIKNLRTKYRVGSLKERGITILEDFAEVKDSLDIKVKDKIKLFIKITNRSLEYLLGHPGTKDFDPDNHRYDLDFGEEMYSAAAFVNSDRVTNYVNKVVSNKEKNVVKVSCDGISENNKIKTDVWTEMDGKRVPMFDFSVKTKNTDQLAQHTDAHKESLQTRFWQDLAGINVAPYFKQKGISEVDDVFSFFNFVNELIKKHLLSQKEDATFVARLAEGIKHSATLGSDLIVLSIDGTTKGLFRTFHFGSFVDALVETGIDLDSKVGSDTKADGEKRKQAWIKIYDTSNDSPSGVLVKIRFRNDKTMSGITIEKGPLLERLTNID